MSDQNPKPQFWKTSGIFMSGMLLGAVLALGGELTLKQMQLSKNDVEIKLPPANSNVAIAPSPSPQFTVPPPPNERSQQPATTPPTPVTQPSTPSLANVPKLPSTSPSNSPTPSPSPTLAATERVSFEVGATGTTVRDSLQANQSKRYTLGCNSDQQMTVKIEEGIVSADIIAPDGAKIGAAVGALQWQGQLSSSGDYTIEVSTPKQSNYAVKIEVK